MELLIIISTIIILSHQFSIHSCVRQTYLYCTDVVLSKLNTFTAVILLALKHLINSQ